MKTFATCLTIVLFSSVCLAQSEYSTGKSYQSCKSGYGVPRHHYGFGGPVAGHVHHSSTVYEGYQRGMAAQIQAQGQYNLLTSLAELNAAQAERMQFETRQARIAAYRTQFSAGGTNPVSVARLAWPAALLKPQYAIFRNVVRQLAAKSAAHTATAADWTRLQRAAGALDAKLARENAGDADEAQQFVAALLASNSAGSNQIAANN